MATCKLPNCDRSTADSDVRGFCSWQHEVKYDHLREDAIDAKIAAEERGY